MNEEISRIGNGLPKEQKKPANKFLSNILGKDNDEDDDEYTRDSLRSGLDFVYTYGATLNV